LRLLDVFENSIFAPVLFGLPEVKMEICAIVGLDADPSIPA
jgi:hypothetical protein